MGLFSWFGKLFGTDKATEKLIDTVSNGLDKAFYTAEEKAEDRARDVTEARSFILKWLESTTGSRLARRVIAFAVTGIWAMQYVSIQALSIIAIWADNAQPYRDSAKVIENAIDQSTGAMMLVLGFYFAAPFMGDIAKGALQKFGRTKPDDTQ